MRLYLQIEVTTATTKTKNQIKKMNAKIQFTKAVAEAYITTTDKMVFIADLLNLFSIDQLTPEIEDETEAQLLSLLEK